MLEFGALIAFMMFAVSTTIFIAILVIAARLKKVILGLDKIAGLLESIKNQRGTPS